MSHCHFPVFGCQERPLREDRRQHLPRVGHQPQGQTCENGRAQDHSADDLRAGDAASFEPVRRDQIKQGEDSQRGGARAEEVYRRPGRDSLRQRNLFAGRPCSNS